jgi:hypothetical protein
VTPGCDCDDVVVQFLHEDDKSIPGLIGSATLRLPIQKLPPVPELSAVVPGREKTVRMLWDAFRKRHRAPGWLQDWTKELKALGARRLMPDYQARIPTRTMGRVGRNDPCPCGSGRKFKRCCGAPGQQARN